jgi:hypothetical protein
MVHGSVVCSESGFFGRQAAKRFLRWLEIFVMNNNRKPTGVAVLSGCVVVFCILAAYMERHGRPGWRE